tara:strand:+ start:2023 stop:2190 length:168 start_codon:yes stop_codon:yes gene_type:complete
MNLEKFIEAQREMAMELLDFGSSREKSEGIGMLRVLKDLKNEIERQEFDITGTPI